ncbi:ADP-ribosyltransferase (plasmid) [Nicoliella spurrieriana]|uniref:ADP-ribosyltransferase n=1 Tax=Nicoliella spurrieriana TaxID=2925830 RepID=A0A976RQU1_9LACO|nr:ADP-ribosyltransferase [Nicoliella spurrieriana]UQS86195.1 ADP-ribosyltransferase [Nicoliella spurrieriana]
MKLIKPTIIASVLLGTIGIYPTVNASDNFNQSLIEYNNTSSYVTDLSSNTWVLNQSVDAYPLVNKFPDYNQPVEMPKFASGSIIKSYLDGYLVLFANQNQPLYVQDFKRFTYSFHSTNVNKSRTKELTKIEQKWRKSLTNQQVKAIGNYTNNGYKSINKYLRYPEKPVSDKVKQQSELIKSAIMKFKTPFKMTIYRGINEAGLKDNINNQPLKVGQIYQDAAFSSSSISHKIATGFQSSILLKINIPAGYNGAYVAPISINSPEKEFLLKPNAQLVISKIQHVTTYFSMHGKVGTAKHSKKIKAKPTKIKYKLITMNLVE